MLNRHLVISLFISLVFSSAFAANPLSPDPLTAQKQLAMTADSKHSSQPLPKVVAVAANNEKVNVNLATMDQLRQIKGIGPKKAAAIIAYREQHGKFKSLQEIAQVNGINAKLASKIADHISFN